MTKRTLILIAAAEAIFLLLGVYFEPTFCVRGHLHGEAFFEGKPTSYWRRELERWELSGCIVLCWDNDPKVASRIPTYSCQSTWFEQMQEGWLGWKRDQAAFPSPKLLQADPNAIPVLEALLDDPSPKISRFARIALGTDPEFPVTPTQDIVDGGHVLFLSRGLTLLP